MKRFLLACLLVALVVCLLPTQAHAASQGDFEYSITHAKSTLTKYTGNSEIVNVPDTLGGCPLVAVGNWAFELCDGDIIKIHKSSELAKTIKLTNQSFYQILRKKLSKATYDNT
jgi:hypothetical protein